jgi:pimeloyl-ACP methyl ester carboxylesterase
MTSYVTSKDGTRIAYQSLGASNQAIVLIGGLLNDRGNQLPLAALLAAEGLTAIVYDRRGRGGSGDTAPYAVARELDDLAALIAQAGGTAAVYGHSSGAGLALEAAAAGLPITRLILHEPPYGGDDQESRRQAREAAQALRAALARGDRAGAIGAFMTGAGLPEEAVRQMSADPRLLAMAPTMRYDHEVMGDFDRDGTVPREKVSAVAVPTLVLAGSESPGFFMDAAERITRLLPDGALEVLAGRDHGAPAEAVAPPVARFVKR